MLPLSPESLIYLLACHCFTKHMELYIYIDTYMCVLKRGISTYIHSGRTQQTACLWQLGGRGGGGEGGKLSLQTSWKSKSRREAVATRRRVFIFLADRKDVENETFTNLYLEAYKKHINNNLRPKSYSTRRKNKEQLFYQHKNSSTTASQPRGLGSPLSLVISRSEAEQTTFQHFHE